MKAINGQNNNTFSTLENLDDMADRFNSYFSTSAKNLITQKTPQSCSNIPKNPNIFEFQQTNEEELLKIISPLKNKSRCGVDGLSMNIIRGCKEELNYPFR